MFNVELQWEKVMNNKERTIRLYKNLGWKMIFAKIRFWDSPYIEVEKLVTKKGLILDLGCGEGTFSNFLAMSSPKRKIIGVDVDNERVSNAYRGIQNTSFVLGDITKRKFPRADAIIFFHLLHHLKSSSDQINLIRKSLDCFKKDGRLIIVEIDKKPKFKYWLTWLTDHFIVAWLFEKKLYTKKILFRSRREWTEILERFGLAVKVTDISKNKPFSHIIIEAWKK